MIFIIYFYTCCRLLWVQWKILVEDSGGIPFRELFIFFFFCWYMYCSCFGHWGVLFLDYTCVHWTHMFMIVFLDYIHVHWPYILFFLGLYTCILNLHIMNVCIIKFMNVCIIKFMYVCRCKIFSVLRSWEW